MACYVWGRVVKQCANGNIAGVLQLYREQKSKYHICGYINEALFASELYNNIIVRYVAIIYMKDHPQRNEFNNLPSIKKGSIEFMLQNMSSISDNDKMLHDICRYGNMHVFHIFRAIKQIDFSMHFYATALLNLYTYRHTHIKNEFIKKYNHSINLNQLLLIACSDNYNNKVISSIHNDGATFAEFDDLNIRKIIRSKLRIDILEFLIHYDVIKQQHHKYIYLNTTISLIKRGHIIRNKYANKLQIQSDDIHDVII